MDLESLIEGVINVGIRPPGTLVYLQLKYHESLIQF